MIPVSSVLDENARLRAENERLRGSATDAEEQARRVLARDAKRKSDVMAYATAAQLWAADHGNQLPVVSDDEFQALMVSGKYLVRIVPATSPGEHYCYATSRDRTEYSFSAWLEEEQRPFALGSDMAAHIIAKSSRSAFFNEGCPRVPGWTSVRV